MTLVCNPKRICDHTLQNHQSQSANTVYYKIRRKIKTSTKNRFLGLGPCRSRGLTLQPGSRVATHHALDQRAIGIWESEIPWHPNCLLSCFSQSCNLGWIWPVRNHGANIKKYHDNTIAKGNIWAKYGLNEELPRLFTWQFLFDVCWALPLSTIEASSGRDGRVRRP